MSPPMSEQFHLNTVQVTAGRVQKIWPRNGHILVVLSLDRPPDPHAAPVELDELDESRWILPQLVLRLDPNTHPVSLFEGDRLDVQGWLDNQNYEENLRDFLTRGQHTDALGLIPPARQEAHLTRVVTHVVPDTLSATPNGTAPQAHVHLDGVVARTWTFNSHRFARLAVYDQHTALTLAKPGKGGQPRRAPHYVTVQFTDGQVGGRAVQFKTNTRVRVTGTLVSRIHSETLRDFLLRAHAADLLAELPNSDKLADLRARYVQTYLVAQTLIQFTN